MNPLKASEEAAPAYHELFSGIWSGVGLQVDFLQEPIEFFSEMPAVQVQVGKNRLAANDMNLHQDPMSTRSEPSRHP